MTHALAFDHKQYGLRWYQNPRFLRYVFSILSVATIISVFELVFVHFVSYPETEESISRLLPALPTYPPIFRSIQQAEKQDRDKKNLYLIMNFMSVILVLLFLIYALYKYMEEVQRKAPVFGANFRATILQTFVLVLLTALYQLFFYNFAKAADINSPNLTALAFAEGTLESVERTLASRA